MFKIPMEKLFPYSLGEDIANAITHGIGVPIAIVAQAQLLYVTSTRGTIADVIAADVFGISMILMLLMSSLYHAIRHVVARDVFKRIDHAMIFIMILGTYTPYVVKLGTPIAYWLYLVICIITLLGVILKSLLPGIPKYISSTIYVTMGWLALVLIREMTRVFEFEVILWLAIGGVVYTVGAIIYAFGKFKYHHAVWHLFVMVGIFSHYISIGFYLY